MRNLVRLFAGACLCVCAYVSAFAQFSAIGPEPGRAQVSLGNGSYALANNILAGRWSVRRGKLSAVSFTDKLTHRAILLPADSFVITLKGGAVITASEMRVLHANTAHLTPRRRSATLSDTVPGSAVLVHLADKEGTLRATWRLLLRDGSNYLRQELVLDALREDVPIADVRMVNLRLQQARVIGSVRGSPLVAGSLFAGFEHPLSTCKVENEAAVCALTRELPLRKGQSVTYSSVIGVAPPGQMRRAFLNYLERERAHPYRTFLHYNSWYDLGYFNQYEEAGALSVIDALGNELTKRRGVTLDSFLFDDGWDDPATLWAFHAGFPRGFASLATEAAKFDAAPGVWMSPWGGYGKPRQERLKFARQAGYEGNEGGFALSGPKYFRRFREICFEFVEKYRVNQFKFDGTGNANRVFPGSEFDSDFDAAIHLISELRAIKPDIYINLTTGTYPSPFWLRYADSIWRGGEDHSFAGVGSDRQQWITYRDAQTYKNIVQGGPLYPLNSLMLHGLIYARRAEKLSADPRHDFADEIHDYFGTGTQLQEMYVTPALLTDNDWDTLAEAAKWSRANAGVLVDTHWIGGDPAKLEVYGWASWAPRKAILVLRNPGDKTQSLSIDVAKAFELPAHAAGAFAAHSPWQKDRAQPPVELRVGEPHTFTLQPFQVLVLDAVPR